MDEIRKPLMIMAAIFIFAMLALHSDKLTASRMFVFDVGKGKELGDISGRTGAAELIYKVEPGDQWATIARDHSVSTRALLEANGANIGTQLVPGTNINLPGAGPAPGGVAPPTTSRMAPAIEPKW
jgi:LysM domain